MGKCSACGGNDLTISASGYRCNDCGHAGLVEEWIEGG